MSDKNTIATNRVNLAMVSMLSGSEAFYGQLAMTMEVQCADIGTIATDGLRIFIDPDFIIGIDKEVVEQKKRLLLELGAPREWVDKLLGSWEKWFKPKTQEELKFLIKHECDHVIDDTFGSGDKIKNSPKYHSIPNEELHKLVSIASDIQINTRHDFYATNFSWNYQKRIPIFEFTYSDRSVLDVDRKNKRIKKEKSLINILDDLIKEYDFKGKFAYGAHHVEKQGKTPSESQKELIRSNIRSASKQAGAGCPSHVKMKITEFDEPQVNWRHWIKSTFTGAVKVDYDYSKPSSRSWAVSTFLKRKKLLSHNRWCISPSDKHSSSDVTVIFDTSGSIYCDKKLMKQIFSEIASIIHTYPTLNLNLICFGTEVVDHVIFNSASIEDLKRYEAPSGGGTDIRCVPPYIQKNKVPTENVIVFTDLYTDIDWGEWMKYNNLNWVVYDNPDAGSEIAVGRWVKFQ